MKLEFVNLRDVAAPELVVDWTQVPRVGELVHLAQGEQTISGTVRLVIWYEQKVRIHVWGP